jgi:hypothetical protein
MLATRLALVLALGSVAGCGAAALDRQALHAEAYADVRAQLGDGATAAAAEHHAESLRLTVRLHDEGHPGGDFTGLLR